MTEKDNNVIASFDNYSPRSAVMREVYEAVADFAKNGFRCIFCGPRGVGKEILANYYVKKFREEHSERSNIPYLSINCASLTDSLAQSELFGHTRGAFTGAEFEKKGLFEMAKGGVLFLDEIGDLSPIIQPSLNRAMGSPYEAFKIGDTRPYSTKDITIIAATEQPKDKIRDSLLDRLQHIITVPSLDERAEDIPAAVEYFVRRSLVKRRDINEVMSLFYESRKNFEEIKSAERKEIIELAREITKNLVPLAQERSWPGNLRSLRTTIDAAVIRARISGGRDKFHNSVVVFFQKHMIDYSVPKNAILESAPAAYQADDSANHEAGNNQTELSNELNRIFPAMGSSEQADLIRFLLHSSGRIFRRKDFEAVFPRLKHSVIHARLRKLRDEKIIAQEGARGELYRFITDDKPQKIRPAPARSFLSLPADICWPHGGRESLNAIRGLLEQSRAVFVGGERGIGKTTCVQALGTELSEERAVYYYPFGDRGISWFLEILSREIQARGIADKLSLDPADPDQPKSQALLISGYIGKLFPAEEKPLLILDNVQSVADPRQERALSAMVKYWKGLSFILVGEKLTSEFQKDDQERILEYHIINI